MIKKLITTALILTSVSTFAVHHNHYSNEVFDNIDDFIDDMVQKHDFDEGYLEGLFSKISLSDTVIEKMTTPYESKPWYKYQEFFLTDSRINDGVNYWKTHKKTLAKAEKEYGVPASIIVAILGVETKYGASKGDFPVFQALSTLAFNYPSRSAFFKKELEEYLLLTDELSFDPLDIKGSYAGAIGLPQFMPSSYRNYAVNYAPNKPADLVNNDDDAIFSIANYLKKNGWVNNQPVTVKAKVQGQDYKTLLSDAKFSPVHSLQSLAEHGIKPEKQLKDNHQVALVEYDTANGHEYWLGLKNFVAISRYNKHKHYVLAVHQLAEKIKLQNKKLNAKPTNNKALTQQTDMLNQLLKPIGTKT